MMKKYNIIALFILLIVGTTSCLKSGLDELETYDLNDISNIRFEYRWWDEANKRMRVVELNVDKSIDAKERFIGCTIKVPASSGTFTDKVREEVSLANLVANMDISAAARISPLDNAPALGLPGDFSSKEFQYNVVAGNGDAATWTIKITNFKK